ncbi:uncharacterized protein LOC119092540 [Pollicipes pollicipes]|uniref:uncharacterized protein LOC119092540 n=1 Tax=Pollicipes pollicipes TaxID=41117 RepID=UPI0018857DC1|nr:uncharacterized protein LOC119092540 [Pollicipes pollicipes]
MCLLTAQIYRRSAAGTDSRSWSMCLLTAQICRRYGLTLLVYVSAHGADLPQVRTHAPGPCVCSRRRSAAGTDSRSWSMCLLTAQIYHRLYEHVFVHVPSNTRIHLGQYVAGVLHYVLGVAAVLAEAPGFVEDDLT